MSVISKITGSVKKFFISDYNQKYTGYCDPAILNRNNDLAFLNDLSGNGSTISDKQNAIRNRNEKLAS